MKKLLSILVAAAALIGAGAEASALTPWRAVAYTRDIDTYGPYITIGAGMANPEWVQVLLNDGTYTGTTTVSISLDCRDNSFNSFDRSLRQAYALPRTFAWDIPTWVTYCRVYVSAYFSRGGALSAAVQARY